LVAKFRKTERYLIQAILKNNIDDQAFAAMGTLVVTIKEKLAQYDILKVDDLLLRNDLIAIRESKDFLYFKLLEIISENSEPLVFGPEWDVGSDIYYDVKEEILARVSPHKLITNKMRLGALLVGKTMPEHLKAHLRLIKECYAWDFHSAAAIYCRVILEDGFREALKSKPEFRMPQEKKNLEEWSLDWLLNHSRKKGYFYPEAIKRAYKIKGNVNRIVHPTSTRKPHVQMSELEIIKDTFYILEMLFR
jgi:hypothetical protein